MARSLTAKQEKFIDGVVSGLSQSEAYRRAGYSTENMTVEKIAHQAHKVANKPNIGPTIAQRKKEMADKAIWSREQALSMLRDIAREATEANGMTKAQMRGVAVRAIEQANKMCGYNAPEKTELTLSKSLEDVI